MAPQNVGAVLVWSSTENKKPILLIADEALSANSALSSNPAPFFFKLGPAFI
jgi:hypothetical protein